MYKYKIILCSLFCGLFYLFIFWYSWRHLWSETEQRICVQISIYYDTGYLTSEESTLHMYREDWYVRRYRPITEREAKSLPDSPLAPHGHFSPFSLSLLATFINPTQQPLAVVSHCHGTGLCLRPVASVLRNMKNVVRKSRKHHGFEASLTSRRARTNKSPVSWLLKINGLSSFTRIPSSGGMEPARRRVLVHRRITMNAAWLFSISSVVLVPPSSWSLLTSL